MTGRRTLELQERSALTLLAAAMFAEARELPVDSMLAERLYDFCLTLVRGRRGRLSSDDPYEIRPDSDAPVLRRLATFMDAQALALGPWSGVGRALARWASRISNAVAEAHMREAVLTAPSPELIAMAEALGFDVDAPLETWLTQACNAIAARATPSAGGRAEVAEHIMRTGRIWTRREEVGPSPARRARAH